MSVLALLQSSYFFLFVVGYCSVVAGFCVLVGNWGMHLGFLNEKVHKIKKSRLLETPQA